MNRNIFLLIPLTLLLFMSISAQSFSDSRDKAAVDGLMAGFISSWNNDDTAGVNLNFDENILLIGGGVLLEGKKQVLDEWALKQMPVTGDLSILSVDSGLSDNIAYQTGRWSLIVYTPEGPITTYGNHTFIWRKNENGTWKIKTMMISDDTGK